MVAVAVAVAVAVSVVSAIVRERVIDKKTLK